MSANHHLRVVAATLVALVGVHWSTQCAFADITIVNASGGNLIPTLLVPPDNDVVTLDPNPVTYVRVAPVAILQTPLANTFTPGAGFGFTFNPIANPTLDGTLTITQYKAMSRGPHHGAGRLFFTYTRAATDPPLANLRFVQAVSTTNPLGGTTSPYIDPRPNDDTRPFYWTDAEATVARNAAAGTISFSDTSSRTCETHPDVIDWRGTLMLADDVGGNAAINVYDGVEWGWDFVCQPPVRHPPLRMPIPRVPPVIGDFEMFDTELQFDVPIPGAGTQPANVKSLTLSNFQVEDIFDVGADEVQIFQADMDGVVDLPGLGLSNVPFHLNGTVETVAHGKAGNQTGTFQTEMLSMEMNGTVATTLGMLNVRVVESPTEASLGQTSISEVLNLQSKDPNEFLSRGGDGFLIDSFFDVFTEISLDGGQTFGADKNGMPAKLSLVPEPSSVMLAAIGLFALLGFTRRGRAIAR